MEFSILDRFRMNELFTLRQKVRGCYSGASSSDFSAVSNHPISVSQKI